MTQPLGERLLESDPESLEPIRLQDGKQIGVLTETQGEKTRPGAQRAEDEDRSRWRRSGLRSAGRAALTGPRHGHEIGRNGRLRDGRQTESHAGQPLPSTDRNRGPTTWPNGMGFATDIGARIGSLPVATRAAFSRARSAWSSRKARRESDRNPVSALEVRESARLRTT